MKKLFVPFLLIYVAAALVGCSAMQGNNESTPPAKPDTTTAMHCTDGFCYGKVNGKPTTMHCTDGFCF